MNKLEENEKQRQLFGTLFGFRVGDRVKTKVKVLYGYRFYWKYGRVMRKVEPDERTGEERVKVLFSGERWACTLPISKLVRCRKYDSSRR